MKTNIACILVISLLVLTVVPFFVASLPVKAQTSEVGYSVGLVNTGQWWQMNTTTTTVLFPVDGQKPMFLWYYNNNSQDIYSVKYRGLIEYLPLDGYFTPDCEANPQTMQSLMLSRYGMGGGMHMNQIQSTINSAYQNWQSNFHPSYLPFSACSWQLEGPSQGIDEDGNSYVSFNLTLSGAPSEFGFAQNNVTFNCWLYENETVQNPYGSYMYNLGGGELAMDFSVNSWSWNSQYMSNFFGSMSQNYDVNVPERSDSLTLWCDFGQISSQDLGIALHDADEGLESVPANSTLAPTGLLEGSSIMTDIIAGGNQILMQNMLRSDASPLGVPSNQQEIYRIQFAQDDQTLPGYFNFANSAAIIDRTTGAVSTEGATASYRTADNYMQLYICYSYFGEDTLVHDPSIGIDTNAQLIPENVSIITILILVTILALSVAVTTKYKKISTHSLFSFKTAA